MPKIAVFCLALSLSVSAFAQQPDTSFPGQPDSAQTVAFDTVPLVIHQTPVTKTVVDTAAMSAPLPEKTPGVIGGVNMWFLTVLCMILAGFVGWGLRIRYEKRDSKKTSDSKPVNTASPMPTEYHPAQPAAETIVAAERPIIPDTVIVPEPAKAAPAPPPPVSASQLETSGVPEVPQPEVFYMTVPGTDGSFAAGARKSSPAGCLYKFVVAPETPQVAAISFAGNETDMRNAQAFRDLELLPVCSFSGMPDTNTFRFTQTPGRAVFDGNAWQVKEKINIAFTA